MGWNLFKRSTNCLHLWGPIEYGYQYCTKCGIARIADCRHNWEVERSNKISNTLTNNTIGEETVYKCILCTQRKYVRTELNKEPISKFI
jgi:hypothetical protein